jgi:hypothetical protein
MTVPTFKPNWKDVVGNGLYLMEGTMAAFRGRYLGKPLKICEAADDCTDI